MSSADLSTVPQTLRRANDVFSSKEPPPELLFDEFWREGELAMLFGEAGAGKSLLAVQLADSLARGTPIDGLKMPRRRRRVLYVDLVLTAGQWAMRYSRPRPKGRREYDFSRQFFRECPAEGTKVTDWLSGIIKNHKIDVVVIDDLSFVTRSDDGTRETLEMMRELRRMTRRHRVSVLVLADSYAWAMKGDISERDLRRNRVLCAYADSVFAIEAVNNTDRRRVFQTRSQAGEAVWTMRDPARFNLTARDDGFVGFTLEKMPEDKRRLIVQIKEMRMNGRHTYREIADSLRISKSTVGRLLAQWRPELELCDDCGKAARPPHITLPHAANVPSPVASTNGARRKARGIAGGPAHDSIDWEPEQVWEKTDDLGEEIFYDFEDLLAEADPASARHAVPHIPPGARPPERDHRRRNPSPDNFRPLARRTGPLQAARRTHPQPPLRLSHASGLPPLLR